MRRMRLPLITLSALLGLTPLYGVGCDTSEVALITSPLPDETIPASGLFTVSMDFSAPLTSASTLQIELTSRGTPVSVDVTSAFGTSFVGVTSATANFDALALGLVPGIQKLIVRLDLNGDGVVGIRVQPFNWFGVTPCEQDMGAALSDCFLTVSDATRQCYLSTGSACDPLDPQVVAAQNQLRSSVTSSCDDTLVRGLGYGSLLTANGLADRLIEECVGNSAGLAARVFGGPHAKVLGGTLGGQDPAGQACLDTAYAESASFVDLALNTQIDCVLDPASCVPFNVDSTIAIMQAQDAAVIDAACPSDQLEALIGLTPDEALSRARTQSECMVAAASGDTQPLSLRCTPGNLEGVIVVATDPPGLTPFGPGVPTKLRLDEAVWGTRCGDGSEYYFWIEMPPVGGSVEKIHMFAQGGGACFTTDCLGQTDSLMASDDGYQTEGILNPGGIDSDVTVDPFTDWTKANFEYCTQDIHAGGGFTNIINGTFPVERYGAVNIRAAMQVLRNLVAERANQESPEGYRPDNLQVLFSGNSAGGFGVANNLHYVLDDLRWSNTVFAAGAGTSVNPGTVPFLGPITVASWALRKTAPPYCLESTCNVLGADLYAAHSERLLGLPAQQLLVAHNQIDDTQRSTQLYGTNTVAHVNALRDSYCASQGLPGVFWYMDAIPVSSHSIFSLDSLYLSLSAVGTPLPDWIAGGVFDPTNVIDRVEEGNLVTEFPGVLPFNCPVN